MRPKRKKDCACALENQHSPNCPFKNFHAGEESASIDFDALRKMLEEMEKRVLGQKKEKQDQKSKSTQIFVAPVIKITKKKKQDR